MSATIPSGFAESLREAHPGLTDEIITNLHRFYTLFCEYNDSHDLSRLKRTDDIIEKHFVDSVIVDTLIDLPPSLLDIGTGAGFPGIPLKIVRPDIRVILAEPRPLRVEFMERSVEALGLKDVNIFAHKVNEKMHFEVDGVITRAFESTAATLTRCVNFLPEGGKIILMKGPGVDEELTALDDDIRVHYSMTDDIRYMLPGSRHERRLVVFTKQTPFVRRYFAVSEIPELTAGRPIVSGSNKQYKELRKAAAPGGIKKTSRTLFSGVKIISELIASRPDQAEELIIYDSYATQDPLMLSVIDWFDSRNRLVLTKKSLFNDLDTAGSRQPLCVASVPEIGPFRKQDGKTDTMIALPFQDPVNTGTVIRSAAAFGLDAVMLTGESAHPFHTRSIRASAGTVFTARLYGGPFLHDLPDFCSENGFTPVTLDAAGTPLDEYRFPERFILIPGVEGPGLPEALKHLSVSVPISPGVESLNAAVSASVVMYEFYKRKLRTGI